MSEYVWVWSAAFIMAILYGIMFLHLSGFIIIDEDGWHWAGRTRVRPDLATEDDAIEIERNMAKNLILYVPFFPLHHPHF